MSANFQLLNLSAIQSSILQESPFPYTIVSNCLNLEAAPQIQRDYPEILDAGSFPLASVSYGPMFEQLINELKSDAFRKVIAEKLSMDLSNRPLIITVRGKADLNDGRIHTDTKAKMVTVLLYMNDEWDSQEGRLRLLNDNKSLDNYFAEIPPQYGTMLIFKVTRNGWHGHKTFIGTRKVIQLNFVTHEGAMNKHGMRHRISAAFKKVRRKTFEFLGIKTHECPDC